MHNVLAFDRASVRSLDEDGRLHVSKTRITKANVCPYYGREIPKFAELGLDPGRVYQLLRDPVELERGASTFARIPILSKHSHVTVDSPKPELIAGSVGSNVAFDGEYLNADLCFWDKEAIAGIETGAVRELSCGYYYDAVMDAGTYKGQAYDGKMTNIRGNHLAPVSVGRAGSDVLVADKKPSFFMEKSMNMTKLGKALFASLSAASKALAADSALPALVGQADRKTFDKPKVKAALLALDSEMDADKLDSVVDSIVDVEHEPKAIEPAAAVEETPIQKINALLEGKVDPAIIEQICAMLNPVAMDTDPDEEVKGMKEEEVKAAMDALAVSIRKEMKEAELARRDVREVVGDVIGMDSAIEVYGFALDQMKIERKDVDSLPALRALFKVASTKSNGPAPSMAQDSGESVKLFPALARIRNI